MHVCGIVCLIILATSACVMSENEVYSTEFIPETGSNFYGKKISTKTTETDTNLYGRENSTKTPETDTFFYGRENATDHPQTKDSRVNTTVQSETSATISKWELGFTGQEQMDENGYNISNQRIVGGTVLAPYSWPHLVYLESYVPGFPGMACGGTIYNENYIITAAHCVYSLSSQEKRSLKVYAGVHNLRAPGIHMQSRYVSNIIIHPEYKDPTLANDIALLKVSLPLDLGGAYVRPLEINTDNSCPLSGLKCRIAGWGRLSEGGHIPSVPYKVDVTVMSNQACNLVPDRLFLNRISDFHICAGDAGKDSCQGDSGGPFVCSCGGINKHAGIVSWGKGCARPRLPGVYTRVSFFRDWILRETGSPTPVPITTRPSTRPTTRPTTKPTTRSTTRSTTTIKETFNWFGYNDSGYSSAPRVSISLFIVLFVSFCLVGYA